EKYFNYSFLHKLIFELLEFDDSLKNEYGDLGTKWLGREISIVGTFAALGRYALVNSKTPIETLDIFRTKLIQNPEVLNLQDFEHVRNSLDLSKINIGTVNKNAVYNGVYELLKENVATI